MTEVINFCSRKMPHYNFSNFALWEINVDGQLWKTSEHYYQAMKFEGINRTKIKATKTPGAAAKLGRSLKMVRPENWDDLKDSVMWKAIYAKFTQYTHLRDELLGTGDAILVEHRKKDSYWGDGGDGSGINMLGFQLMALRHFILDEQADYLGLVRDLYFQKFGPRGLLHVGLGGRGIMVTTNDVDLGVKLPSDYLGASIEIKIISG